MSEYPQPPVVHLHGPRIPHGDALVRANSEGLAKLYRLIYKIVESHPTGQHQPTTMTTTTYIADGEGFDLHLTLDTSDWQSQSWQGAGLPYADELPAGIGAAPALHSYQAPVLLRLPEERPRKGGCVSRTWHPGSSSVWSATASGPSTPKR